MPYDVLLTNSLVVFVFMTGAWLIARKRKRLDTVDIAWGLTFIVIAWASVIQNQTFASQLIANIVTLWGIRLAWHIYSRSKNKPNDKRYDELSSKWKGNFWLRAYVSIFLLQGLLALVVSLPATVSSNDLLPGWGWLSLVGVALWSFGFVIEVTADYELGQFLKRKDHPKIMQEGLWKYSRHPNYFGELVQWWAIAIIALQVSYGWIGLIGPLTLSTLIIFVSGIPPIERAKAKDKDYQEYKKHTSALIPLPRH